MLLSPAFAIAAGLLLLLPGPLLAAHRMHAAMLTLAMMLGAAFIRLCWMPEGSMGTLSTALLICPLLAAPLLERARFHGLLLAALLGGVALLYTLERLVGWWMPPLPHGMMLPLLLTASLVVGLLGGMMLPLNPRRHTARGETIWHVAPQAQMLAGWVLLLAGVAGLAPLQDGQWAAVLAGGFIALLQAHYTGSDDGLQKAGEGMMAGLMLSLAVTPTPAIGAVLGVVAALCVLRGEALAIALRMADPHHFMGALLMPSLLGLLVPGLLDGAALAPALTWMGAALGVAVAVALLLWPIIMVSVGMALPPRLVREGVRR